MLKRPEMPEVALHMPEHEEKIRALGYAFGMYAGMASPASHGQIYAKGLLTTNDLEAFEKTFQEGHELGFAFVLFNQISGAFIPDHLPILAHIIIEW